MKVFKIFFLVLFLAIVKSTFAQDENNETEEKIDKLIPKEFSIPPSPLFDLMGVTPATISRTSDVKDFKVDWSFKNWRLSPNIALQSQPIWELFYNRKNISNYQNASYFERMLASTDFSIGTVLNEQNDRRLGFAIKLNVFKEKDPLLQKNVFDDIEKQFEEENFNLKNVEKTLIHQLDSVTNPKDIVEIKKQLSENDLQLSTFFARRNKAIQERALDLNASSWNAAFIDVAFGRIYTYKTDSLGSLKSLVINRNSGSGAWVNFGFGVGKRGLISGLLRSNFYEEQLFFDQTDSLGNFISDTAIAGNKLLTMGINFRYGGPVFNFFAEIIYDGKTTKTPVDALNNVFKTPEGFELVPTSVKWDKVTPYTLNFGGDWRISRNLLLNYGIRTQFDKDFKKTTFTPVVNLSCMMR